jgi:hypothetical protein
MVNAPELVATYIQVASGIRTESLDELVALLAEKGIGVDVAERLIAFVPMACAHALLAPLGVQLQPTYWLVDPETDRRWRGALAEEPIFVAAFTLAREAAGSGWVRAIASTSAEWQAMQQLKTPAGVILTEPILMRVPLPHT